MKFPFVTRAMHEAEIAELEHAADYQKQRRNFWLDKHRALEKENAHLLRCVKSIENDRACTEKNLREVISQRDMASKNYERLMEDYHDRLQDIFDLENRLSPFLRKHGPNGKFVKQPKGETP